MKKPFYQFEDEIKAAKAERKTALVLDLETERDRLYPIKNPIQNHTISPAPVVSVSVPKQKISQTTTSRVPDPATMTMIQGTLWDNWGSKVRPKGIGNQFPKQRYGADIEFWTDDPKTILKVGDLKNMVAYRGRTNLIKHKDFVGAVTYLLNENKIGEDYAKYLAQLHAESGPGCSFGLMRTKTKGAGMPYEPFTVVRFEILGGAVSLADFYVNQTRINLVGWVSHTPSGNPLTSGVVSQARNDLTGTFGFKKWSSK